MPSNKDRLYVALHVRGGSVKMPEGEDTYHWALITGPKTEDPRSRGKRFHAKETMAIKDGQARSTWNFEEADISMAPEAMILVRLLVAKVLSSTRLAAILRQVPMRPGIAGWNCVGWVREALELLARDGQVLRPSMRSDWSHIRDAIMEYVSLKKAAHRFDGLAVPGQFPNDKVPTWDLHFGEEIVP